MPFARRWQREMGDVAPRCPDCRCEMHGLMDTQHAVTCSQFDGHEMLKAQAELDREERAEIMALAERRAS